MSEQKPRVWTLRISEDGSGYLYSGSEVDYEKDDYMEVVEKKAYDEAIKLLRLCEEALDKIQHSPKSAEARANEMLATIRESGLLGDK